MFVLSVKTSYKQVISVCGCIAVIAVAIVLSAVLPSHTVQTASVRVSDSMGRVDYLRSLGYEVTDQSEEVREIRMPDEPDAVLEEYNALQETVGRSLEPYYGKRVRLYSYSVTNSENVTPVRANLYVYHDRLIAADVDGKAF